jgi:hypothetical protein
MDFEGKQMCEDYIFCFMQRRRYVRRKEDLERSVVNCCETTFTSLLHSTESAKVTTHPVFLRATIYMSM